MTNLVQPAASAASAAQQASPGSESILTTLVSSLPSLLLVLLGLSAAIYLRTNLRALIDALIKRLEQGGSLKMGSVELGEIRVPATPTEAPAASITSFVDSARARLRKKIYDNHRNLMITHRLFPSHTPGQTYDIWIYLLGHKRSLDGVDRVEYFLGDAWSNQVFVSTDRGKRFGVLASAYGGGFLCLARIYTTEGEPIDTWRYIDFEQGVFGKE